MDTPARQGIPLRPDYSAVARPSDAIVRAIVAHAHSFIHHNDAPPEHYAKHLFRNDAAVEAICKAASSPATTTTSGWSSQLAASATLDLISTLI